MSKHLSEICNTLVQQTHGNLISRIFRVILDIGRPSNLTLCRATGIPQRIVNNALVFLIQQDLVRYDQPENSDATYYEVDIRSAYNLLRVGKNVKLIEDRYGEKAADVVFNMQYYGLGIIDTVLTGPAHDYPSKTVNSELHGLTGPLQNGAGEPRMNEKEHLWLKYQDLRDLGYIEDIRDYHMLPDESFRTFIKKIVRKEDSKFTNSITGPKKSAQYEQAVKERRKQFIENDEPLEDAWQRAEEKHQEFRRKQAGHSAGSGEKGSNRKRKVKLEDGTEPADDRKDTKRRRIVEDDSDDELPRQGTAGTRGKDGHILENDAKTNSYPSTRNGEKEGLGVTPHDYDGGHKDMKRNATYDEEEWELDAVRLNDEKMMVSHRSRVLANYARRVLGDTPARVYEVALHLMERNIPRCFEEDAKDDDDEKKYSESLKNAKDAELEHAPDELLGQKEAESSSDESEEAQPAPPKRRSADEAENSEGEEDKGDEADIYEDHSDIDKDNDKPDFDQALEQHIQAREEAEEAQERENNEMEVLNEDPEPDVDSHNIGPVAEEAPKGPWASTQEIVNAVGPELVDIMKKEAYGREKSKGKGKGKGKATTNSLHQHRHSTQPPNGIHRSSVEVYREGEDELSEEQYQQEKTSLVTRYLQILAAQPHHFLWGFSANDLIPDDDESDFDKYSIVSDPSADPPPVEIWALDATPVVSAIIQREIEHVIERRHGRHAARGIRILRERGKLDDKHIADHLLHPQHRTHAMLCVLAEAGWVDAQEIPKEASRNTARTIHLWSYDQDKARRLLLDDVYQAMSNILQRLPVERKKVRALLEKSERIENRDRKEEFLNKFELDGLRWWHALETKLWVQLGRMDDLVMLLRDFLPGKKWGETW